MEWIIDNWSILVAIAAILIVVIIAVISFFKLPPEVQKKNIKNWLLGAVTAAEIEFGSGTGALKLRQVYDSFITRYPLISKIVSFETFSFWVDEALVNMKELLKTNKAIETYVNK